MVLLRPRRAREWRWFLTPTRIAGLMLLATLLIFFGYVLFVRANVAQFYPSTCLGNWENVLSAVGKPQLGEGAPNERFNDENSAHYLGGQAQIFCGNFTGEEFKNKAIRKSKLYLSWVILPPTPEAPPEITLPGDQISPLSTSTATSTTTSTTEATASSTLPEVATSTPSSTLLESATSSPSSSPISIDEVTTTSTATSTPTPTPDEVPSSTQSSSTSFLPFFVSRAHAQTESSTPSSTSSSTQTSTSLEASTSILVVPYDITSSTLTTEESSSSQEYIQVDFSTEENEWRSLATLRVGDWNREPIELPLGSIDDIQNLQISIKVLSGGQNFPTVYLDGMRLDVEYVPNDEEIVAPLPPTKASTTVPAQLTMFDEHAPHGCEITPFSLTLRSGAEGVLALALHPANSGALATTELGSLPQGIHGAIALAATDRNSGTITLSADRTAAPGSFSLLVVYKEVQAAGSLDTTFCQYNLVVE